MKSKMAARQNIIYFTLILSIAMCFIGHGSFGIITKPVWCNYFAVFGIGKETAYHWMPVIGVVDIALGITMLIYPNRAIAAWLVIWGIFTAGLRPLSGEPFAEAIERAGNYGAPLALLLLCRSSYNNRNLFTKINTRQPVDSRTEQLVFFCLRIVVFLLLAGHGWLNILHKKGLLDQYGILGFSDPAATASFIGYAEIIAAFMVLIKPVRPLLLVLFIWKMSSELFYPHYGLLEWVERGGSYACLLVLFLMTKKISLFNVKDIRRPVLAEQQAIR